VKCKRPKQREFWFDAHARVWTSMPEDVHRHVIEIIAELLRAELRRRREVQRSDQRQDQP
jgi:hypothetical protein